MSIGSRKSFKSTWKKNIFKIQRCSRNAKSRGKYGTGVGVGVKRDAANLGCKASRRHALANRPASSIPPSTHLHPPSILHPDPPSPPSTRLHPCHVPPQQLTRLAPASALNLSVAASLTPSLPLLIPTRSNPPFTRDPLTVGWLPGGHRASLMPAGVTSYSSTSPKKYLIMFTLSTVWLAKRVEIKSRNSEICYYIQFHFLLRIRS